VSRGSEALHGEPVAPPKSKAIAGILGLIAPGLGQVFVGHTVRGVAWLVFPLIIVSGFVLFASEPSPSRIIAVIGVSAVLAYAGAVVDVMLIPTSKHRATTVAPVVVFALAAFLVAPLFAVLLRAFVVEAFKVPSGAMIPTIGVGDHLFADKAVYRKRAPRRGEVFIFEFPERREQDFVKRAIAIGGDRLEIRGGHPIINGWQVPSCVVGPYRYAEAGDGMSHEGELFVEFLDEASYLVFLDKNAFGSDYQGPFMAAPGETWVLGDNRNNSHDSRMWFGGQGGGVPASHVKGRARTVWLSPQPSQRGHDLAGEPVAPSPELAAPIAACLAKRPSNTTPPQPK
jgi:signal peptidase I